MFISPETSENVNAGPSEGRIVRLACTIAYEMAQIISLTERSHILRSRALIRITIADLEGMISLLRGDLGELE